MARAPATVSDETLALSRYMARALGRRLPTAVVEKAKHHILDTLAAMVSGSRLGPGRKAIAFVATLGGVSSRGGEAGIVGTRLAGGAAQVALANGIMAHADETDDSHLTSHTHPGSAIVPAALAASEVNRSSGRDFLRAVVLGYDVGCRSTKALDVDGFSASWRSPHSFGGTFGAGAAAGALFGLDPLKARHLLSYSAQLASGCGSYMHDPGHIEKAFVYAGKSAHNGVLAASLVANGFTGAIDVFSGERNFLDAYAAIPHREELAAELGRRYEVVGTNIKKWTVGSPIQSVLDSVEGLIRDHGIGADAVEAIEVRMAPRYARTADNRPFPDVNVQHLTALMLVDGTATFASCHDAARMKDPRVLALRRRLRLVPTESLEGLRPARQAIVVIDTRDGRRLTRHTKAVRGTIDNPMGRDEVVAKVRDLMSGILGKARTGRLIDTVMAIEDVKDMRKLRPLLSAPTPKGGSFYGR